jgi:hypothetical protein
MATQKRTYSSSRNFQPGTRTSTRTPGSRSTVRTSGPQGFSTVNVTGTPATTTTSSTPSTTTFESTIESPAPRGSGQGLGFTKKGGSDHTIMALVVLGVLVVISAGWLTNFKNWIEAEVGINNGASGSTTPPVGSSPPSTPSTYPGAPISVNPLGTPNSPNASQLQSETNALQGIQLF